jgi:hypothetical protein
MPVKKHGKRRSHAERKKLSAWLLCYEKSASLKK